MHFATTLLGLVCLSVCDQVFKISGACSSLVSILTSESRNLRLFKQFVLNFKKILDKSIHLVLRGL